MDLLKKADYNAKITQIKGKMHSITGLGTTAAINTVENKIPNFSDLFEKTDCDAKTSDIETKCLTTSDYNKFTNKVLNKKIKEGELVDKSNISRFIQNFDLGKKIVTLLKKAEFKVEQDKIEKRQAFNSSYFCGKSHFEDDGAKNYFMCQPTNRYFKKVL